MSCAARNREIKKVLTKAFEGRKVTVRGSRGTAYGWVRVDIDWTPRDPDQAREMEAEIWKLFGAAGLSKSIGTYGYDDPGSDYGHGRTIHINFNRPRYFRTHRHSDGTMAVQREYMGEWETLGAGA